MIPSAFFRPVLAIAGLLGLYLIVLGGAASPAAAQNLDIPNGLDIPRLELPDLDEGGFGDEDLQGEGHEYFEEENPEEAFPQSADEGKRDRLSDPNEAPVAAIPVDRKTRLRQLYDRLGAASDATAAEPIIKAIRDTWQVSGSPTIDLLLSRASKFAQEADLELALKIVDAAIDLAPDEAEAWHQRAMLHFLQENYQDALADLRRALSREPSHFDALNSLGIVFEELGQKRAALEAYRKALKVNPFLDSAREAEDKLSREVEGQDI